MSQRYIGGVVTETTNVAQSPWTGEWTQQAALQGFAGAQAPLKVANSLRFRSSASAYLSRTPASAGNRKTWTWSGWVKRGALGSSSRNIFFGASSGTSDATWLNFGIQSGGTDTFFVTTYNYVAYSSSVYRDPSAWYHFVVAFDTTQATSSNRIKVYVNGSLINLPNGTFVPTLNADYGVNATIVHQFGADAFGNYFDGYLANVDFIDGQALPPTAFGTINKENGVWSPIAYTGAYGTNGFRLNFSNGTSTTTLGYDSSGNGNNWTTNNISLTAGSTYDWMIDSPTKFPGSSYGVGNYAVLNPLQTGSYVTGSNANLTITGNTATDSALSLSSIGNLTAGKWYWEYTQGTVGSETCGAMLQAMNGISLLNGESTTNSYGIGVRANGAVYGASKTTATITSWTTGDVIGIAVDIDNGAAYWSKNGTWLNSGVPTSGASKTGAVGAWTPSSSVVVTPSFGAYSSGSVSATFGQRPFAYTPPSGYKSLCTQNLPGVTIQNGAQYMGVSLWTGSGSNVSLSNAVNGVSFQPDFVWIKDRSTASAYALYDSVRGNTKVLSSNATTAEYTQSPTAGLNTFNSNGFSITYPNTGDYYVNISGDTYVGWQWKAGGTAVTNTAGSITSSVSANTTSGFSVVTWTCNNTANQSIGHGLGVAPSLVIVKDRDQGTGFNWNVWFTGFTANEYLQLNTTIAKASYNTLWYTVPDATKIYIGTAGTAINNATDKMVAYCFAAIPGYSAFGSYTGNGSADGPFVFTGMRSRFILIKRTDSAANWRIFDTSRDVYNVESQELYPNLSNAEGTFAALDGLSNGFKLRNSDTAYNASGGTYIYAAFAENPFQNALAR